MDEILFLFVGQYLEHLQQRMSRKQKTVHMGIGAKLFKYVWNINKWLSPETNPISKHTDCLHEKNLFFSVAKIDPVHPKFLDELLLFLTMLSSMAFFQLTFFQSFSAKSTIWNLVVKRQGHQRQMRKLDCVVL